MATKPSTSRRDPRHSEAMESIVTRRKSAQQKRQLRNKDSSIKRISQFTQLLLSPTKTNTSKSPPTKSKTTVSKNPLTSKNKNIKEKVSEKKELKQAPLKRNKQGKFMKRTQSPVRNAEKLTEYYPNKLKRNVEGKKVVLKPKHEMQVVVGTRIGKRKLVLPQKGADTGLRSPPAKLQKLAPISNTPKPKQKLAPVELSIEDLVHLHNDELLDDEDWLEILTCPSPVWWEDPPDPGFDDEPKLQLPIITDTQQIQKPVKKRNKAYPMKTEFESQANITQVLSESNVKVLEMKKADYKFMRKRSKLENLLGNIKNKINDCIESGSSSGKLNLKCKSDIEIKKTEIATLVNIGSDNKLNSPVPKKEKRTSESTEEDPFSNFRDDDLLNDLENIEIPMNPNEHGKCVDKNTKLCLKSSNAGEDEICSRQKANAENYAGCKILQDKSDPVEEPLTVVTLQSSSGEENNEIANLNSQINKLTTTSIEQDVSSSPVSAKSVISMSDETYETSSVKSQEVDSISVTNIKFIDEDASSSKACKFSEKTYNVDIAQAEISNEEIINKICNFNSADKSRQSKQSCNTENVAQCNNIQNPRKERDCMTVYKIICKEKYGGKLCNKDNKNNTMMSKINELIKASKEYNNFKANLQSKEASSKLDSFFKKNKNHQSRPVKRPETVNNNSIDCLDIDNLNVKNSDKNQDTTSTNENEEIEYRNENKKEIVEDNTQNKSEEQVHGDEKSIVVPNSSTAIKYCLKCSCIFDTNNCDYCVEKAKNSTENHIGSCKNGSKLSSREKSAECDSFLCDLCETGNNN